MRHPQLPVLTKRLAATVLVVLLMVSGYAGLVAVRRMAPVLLPKPLGPHQVSRTTFDWTDNTRVDPLAPQPGTRRELSVWLWYPATQGEGSQPAAYAPGAWAQLHFPGPVGLLEGPFDRVHTFARDDAPVAGGRFPVVVLEPGLGFSAPQYTVLAEALASRGYLVAGVTPTFSANVTVLHGNLVNSTLAGDPPDLGGHSGPAAVAADRLVDIWAADARFVATSVLGLNGAGRFADRVAQGQVSYIGHSFGGAAALQACSTDARCAGAVDMDGTQFGSVVHTGLHVPLLLLGSQDSCITGTCPVRNAEDRADRDTARSLLAASTRPVRCYSITGAQHFNFTDYAVLYLAPPLRNLLPLGSIDGARGLTIQDAYLTAFLDRVVLQRPPVPTISPPDSYPEARAVCGVA